MNDTVKVIKKSTEMRVRCLMTNVFVETFVGVENWSSWFRQTVQETFWIRNVIILKVGRGAVQRYRRGDTCDVKMVFPCVKCGQFAIWQIKLRQTLRFRFSKQTFFRNVECSDLNAKALTKKERDRSCRVDAFRRSTWPSKIKYLNEIEKNWSVIDKICDPVKQFARKLKISIKSKSSSFDIW